MGGFLTEHPVVGTVAFGGVFGALILVVVWLVPRGALPAADGDARGERGRRTVELVEHPLTGVLVEEVPDRPALIVKVSNSPEARPQTGLDLADVVFEELTEGGVTRFITVLHSQLPEVVGPGALGPAGRPPGGLGVRPARVRVPPGPARRSAPRSGRPQPSPSPRAHPGSSATTAGTPRTPFAPHDLFLEVATAIDTVEARGAVPLGDLGWRFSDDPPAGGSPAITLEVPMSRAYATGWTYDPGAGPVPAGAERRGRTGHRQRPHRSGERRGPRRPALRRCVGLPGDRRPGGAARRWSSVTGGATRPGGTSRPRPPRCGSSAPTGSPSPSPAGRPGCCCRTAPRGVDRVNRDPSVPTRSHRTRRVGVRWPARPHGGLARPSPR
jgi:hypothetical protein